MSKTTNRFPADFVWGVATSAYQIEGASYEDGRGESIWDAFCRMPGRIAGRATGEVACDHYHRWPEDLDLLARLGVNAYRFSVAWPRVLPSGRGRIEQRGLDFYDRLVDGLLEMGVSPYVTLYHCDLPVALQESGGWADRTTVNAFVEYADAVTRRLGDRVASYATLNEPWCSAYLGHERGEHAPGLGNRTLALTAAHNLLLAHGHALPVMRENAPRSRHGIVLNLSPAYPASPRDEDVLAARRYDDFFNRWYLDPIFRGEYPEDAWRGYGRAVPDIEHGDLEAISRPLDFLGVNYYSRALVGAGEGPWPAVAFAPSEGAVTAMGWEIYPQGLVDLLVRLKEEYDVPDLYITENGAAFQDVAAGGEVLDGERVDYLARHVDAIGEARARGAPVRGYFAWSLMDNFEWAHGYDKRFGLVHVDYETQQRTLKQSAYWYRDLIAEQAGNRIRSR
jgi:beta-glucosidase